MLAKVKRLLERQYLKSTVTWCVWDFDGTFYRSNKVYKQLEKEFYKFFIANTQRNVTLAEFKELSKQDVSLSSMVSRLTGFPEIEVVTKVESGFDTSKHIPKNMQMVELIYHLENFKHLILSNSSREHIVRGLQKVGFKSVSENNFTPFDQIFDRETVLSMKPDKSVFKVVHAYTKSPKRKHLMIGDSYHHDILPAREFGYSAKHIDDFLWLFGY